MEMLSYFRGDKHEFCLVVIKFKHVRRRKLVILLIPIFSISLVLTFFLLLDFHHVFGMLGSL